MLFRSKIAGLDISEAGEFSIRKAGDWFGKVHKSLTKQQNEIASRILKEINDRLIFLKEGRVICQGPTEAVLTPENIGLVYGVEAEVRANPFTNSRQVSFRLPVQAGF